MPGNQKKPIHAIKASPGKVKRLPAIEERVYDQWTESAWNFNGPNIGNKVFGGYVQFVRFRDTPDGPEEDPSFESSATAQVPDIYNLAANPDWPEAKAFLEAAHVF